MKGNTIDNCMISGSSPKNEERIKTFERKKQRTLTWVCNVGALRGASLDAAAERYLTTTVVSCKIECS